MHVNKSQLYPMKRMIPRISKMMTRMVKKNFLIWLDPRRETTIEILKITLNAIDAFVLKTNIILESDINA
jgi:hypothetical protein